uniref:Uncharacterized protein n=1 Tax=Arundo donax TaxID=35708 RepID=A0A0A9H469_ARUDO
MLKPQLLGIPDHELHPSQFGDSHQEPY